MHTKISQARRQVRAGIRELTIPEAVRQFHTDHYLRHTARRLEHLASLGLPLTGRTVLEVGAGVGDHSQFYLDRGCDVTITEARPVLLSHLRARFPQARVEALDMEQPDPVSDTAFDIVHCYGLLYHLGDPEGAIRFMAEACRGLLLLETCVSYGDEPAVNLVDEPSEVATQAVSGTGCRPTRSWLERELRRHFEHVYLPRTQPVHDEFPTDWSTDAEVTGRLHRSIFVASHSALDLATLVEGIPEKQDRQR